MQVGVGASLGNAQQKLLGLRRLGLAVVVAAAAGFWIAAARVPGGGYGIPEPMWVLGAAAFPLEAVALIAVPGGIDAHVHFDQDTADGSVFCDDFESGSRAAAAGGTTTIIPFAYQSKGQSLRDAVNKYHQRAEGKSLVDYAFHVILSDPSEKIMGQDFPALVADGYTSFKVYMTLVERDRRIAAWHLRDKNPGKACFSGVSEG